jgi:hypothetical protein
LEGPGVEIPRSVDQLLEVGVQATILPSVFLTITSGAP